ncbi:hypothetical protein HYW20_06455 [Candidatus Woesearchaeota archaeon]|nr:hypothetical protein [Candidatus Woesearchaeota archaeon]
MDVDDFLDRELSELGLGTDKYEKLKTGVPEFKEDFQQSPLFESITSSLSRGNLDEAEQSYVRLWNTLAQQNVKWNKEIYEQLAAASRQFSSILNNAYDDIKKKANHAYELISRARAAMKEGKKEQPFKLYSEIQEISNSIPNPFFEEKKIMQEQVMEFYKELKNTTDNELIKRVYILVNELNRMIERINDLVRKRDMPNAIANYIKCMELYNQVPEGFLRHKNSIGMRLLDIYKSLSIYTEISILQRQLSQQPSQRPSQIQQGQQAQKAAEPQSGMSLSEKKESAKRNIEKGFYKEAINDIQEALQMDPRDPEAKVLHAKIKTLS